MVGRAKNEYPYRTENWPTSQSRVDSEQRERQSKIEAEQREREHQLPHEEMVIAHKDARGQRQLMNIIVMWMLNRNGGKKVLSLNHPPENKEFFSLVK